MTNFDVMTARSARGAGEDEREPVFRDMTAFSASGGCSCKLPAKELALVVHGESSSEAYDGDDAAFTTLPSGEVLVTSIDFQNPLVPDPAVAGEIGALNALSDILACGVHPSWAEVILALPPIAASDQVDVGRRMMKGIRAGCAKVGCEITGGHTVVLPTPLIGLAVRGLANASRIKRKSGAKAGDLLVLTKPLGLGVAVAAHQAGFLNGAAWAKALEVLTTPNSAGASLGALEAVNSLTDVTGFGLIGHALEVARASQVTVHIDLQSLPLLPGVARAASAGHVPLLAESNWSFAKTNTDGCARLTDGERLLLSDPQTNGGLLATVTPDGLEKVFAACAAVGSQPTVIGHIEHFSGAFCRIQRS